MFKRCTVQGLIDYLLYEGPCSEIPKELFEKTVDFIAASGNPEIPYTLRIECGF